MTVKPVSWLKRTYRENPTLLRTVALIIGIFASLTLYIHGEQVDDYQECQDRKNAIGVLATVIEESRGSGGSFDLTAIPEFQNLSPEDQAMWAAVSELTNGSSDDEDANSRSFADRALARLPVIDCSTDKPWW